MMMIIIKNSAKIVKKDNIILISVRYFAFNCIHFNFQ